MKPKIAVDLITKTPENKVRIIERKFPPL